VSAHLLDGNVLVALADAAHIHHSVAVAWFSKNRIPFATCPITQGTLLRMLLRHGAVDSPGDAGAVLAKLCAHPRHRFWADDIDYAQVSWQGLIGHRQVTDAYLAALARSKGGKLLTLDKGLAASHPDVVEAL